MSGGRFILPFAYIAGKNFKAMGTGTGNIVPMSAISLSGLKRERGMTREQFEREKKYQAALAVVRSMLAQEVINEEDFLEIERRLKDKFKPVLGGFLL